MRHYLFLSFILLLFQGIQAQEKTEITYSQKPLWIGMIDNPNTNYFEALRAFDLYFKSHPMPEEPEELAHERLKSGVEKTSLSSKPLTNKELEEKEAEQEMALQIKRFKRWKKDVFPFVQEDGRILTADEQIKIWEEVSGRTAKGK